MTFLIIGSTAAHYHLGDAWRAPKDFDVFTDGVIEPQVRRAMNMPVEVFWRDALKDIWADRTGYADLNELYSIKVSHLYWEGRNGKWNVHMNDVLRLKEHGASLVPRVHDTLYKVWEQEFGKKLVDLNMDKADFFDDAVPRKWDHDSVHYSVAYGDHPLYEDFLDGEVKMSMRRVWDAPFETQMKLFREEIYATALERKVIPSDYRCSPRMAYAWALRRTVTSLTKGRSAKFIVENLDKFQAPDVDYVQRHRDNAHKLIPYERKGV